LCDAYQVSLDSLLLYNGLPPGSGLTVGQLILVKLPVAIIPTVELTQATPESTQPIETAEPTEEMVPTATQTEPATIEPTVEEPTGQGNNTLTIVVVAAVVIAAIAVFILLRLRKPIEEEDKDDGQVHDEKQEAHQIDSFHNRSRAQQIELLHEVAEMALEAYPLKVISIEPLRYVLNAEFLVKAGPEDREGDVQEFMMRVNAPGFHSKSEISAEMEWLTALHRETDLKVPFPLQTRTDEWVETVSLPAVGEPRHCVLFFFHDTATTEMKATPDHMVFVGAVIARLHKHGASFQAPSGFSRKHWDLEGLKGGMLDVPANKAYGALTDDERKVVDAAEEVTAAAMENLGVNDQVYGLIHGDLHLKSFQYHEGQPQILDFDTCGYGYYIYDLSVAVWDLFDRDDFTSLKEGLLNGYRTERQLSEQEENLLMNFVAGRLMTQTLAWAGRRDDPHLGEAADSAIAKQVRQMGMLLQILAP
jgi:Ser/Thr protein kinase RdoA (MazF antagonist)